MGQDRSFGSAHILLSKFGKLYYEKLHNPINRSTFAPAKGVK